MPEVIPLACACTGTYRLQKQKGFPRREESVQRMYKYGDNTNTYEIFNLHRV
jgi:hypothetical protein